MASVRPRPDGGSPGADGAFAQIRLRTARPPDHRGRHASAYLDPATRRRRPALRRAPLPCPRPRTPSSWPSFRGPDASGVEAAGQPPLTWDVAAGTNVAWKTPIPGLGHSSPVVWGDRIFVTSAVPLPGPGGDAGVDADSTVTLKEVGSIPNHARHAWRLYCLDRATGRVLWERTAHEGMPKAKRHAKASQASATAATDGTHVVAMMGSEGLYAFDMAGTPLWTKNLGHLNLGYVDDKNEEWGPGSSPVIHDGLVIVQNDRHADSYVVAFDVRTGQEKWRVGRDEMPSWATPLVHRGTRTTVVTNSPKAIRGHDAATGKELWQVADGTQVKVPTPVVFEDLVIVTGGWPTGRPADLRDQGRHRRGGVEARTRVAVHDHAARLPGRPLRDGRQRRAQRLRRPHRPPLLPAAAGARRRRLQRVTGRGGRPRLPAERGRRDVRRPRRADLRSCWRGTT